MAWTATKNRQRRCFVLYTFVHFIDIIVVRSLSFMVENCAAVNEKAIFLLRIQESFIQRMMEAICKDAILEMCDEDDLMKFSSKHFLW